MTVHLPKAALLTPMILGALLLAACGREPPAVPPPALSALQNFNQRLVGHPACATTIPMHWSPSLPVPLLIEGRLHYRVFFSGWSGRPDTGIVLDDAEGDALFSADAKVLECRQRSETGRKIPVLPPMVMSLDEHEARLRPLYGLIEEIGRLYASGKPASEAERLRVRAFLKEFPELIDRGHLPAYRALSPDFWTWVEKNV